MKIYDIIALSFRLILIILLTASIKIMVKMESLFSLKKSIYHFYKRNFNFDKKKQKQYQVLIFV